MPTSSSCSASAAPGRAARRRPSSSIARRWRGGRTIPSSITISPLAYGALKRTAEEVAAMGEAFARDPTLPLAANVLFPARRATCDWRGHARLLENLRLGAIGQSAPSIPFLTLYLDDPAMHLAGARRWVEAEKTPARPLVFRSLRPARRHGPDPRRLRLGRLPHPSHHPPHRRPAGPARPQPVRDHRRLHRPGRRLARAGAG